MGFVRIDGPKGADILDTITTTRAQQAARGTMDMFASISELPGISGASDLRSDSRSGPAQGQLDLRAVPKKARK
jgi:hypothetical protein